MATIKVVGSNKDVSQAYKHHQKGSFTVKDSEAIFAFWANDVERTNDGEVIAHHGRATALKCQEDSKNNGEIPIYLMEDFEGKNKVKNSNEYEKRTDLSLVTISAVCALTSASYAKSASGVVLTSVKGANINSFFRVNELPNIMNNQDITHIINVSRDNLTRKPFDKKTVYHILRDEWLDSAIKDFEKTNREFINKAINPLIYQSSLSNMASEILLSKNALNQTKHPLNLPSEYHKYSPDDFAKELKRLNLGIKLMKKYSKLKEKFNELLLIKENSFNMEVLSHLYKQFESKAPLHDATSKKTISNIRNSSYRSNNIVKSRSL